MELMYLVEGRDQAALIDTGSGLGFLKAYVEKLTDKPILVLLTHGHVDHAMGAGEFETVYMNRADDYIYDQFLPICPRHPGYDGKSPNGWQRTSSTGLFAPSHGSHVTALIAFLAVTGREYHCPHCLSSPLWVLPRSHRKLFLAPCRGRKPSRPKKESDVLMLFPGTSRRSF